MIPEDQTSCTDGARSTTGARQPAGRTRSSDAARLATIMAAESPPPPFAPRSGGLPQLYRDVLALDRMPDKEKACQLVEKAGFFEPD